MRSLIVTWVLVQMFAIRFSSSITVRLKYSTSDVINQTPPDYVNITVVISVNTTAELRMQRVQYIRLDTPIYTLTTDKDGRPIQSREFVVIPETIGYYQDVEGNAALQIERIDGTTDNNTRISLRGTFTHEGVVYTLSPSARAERDVSTQFEHFDLQELKPHLANAFDYVVPNVTEDVNINKARFIAPLTNRRRKRQTKPDYYIDVVAMVDFGCWKIFLAKAASVRDDAISNIQKYFSLIFNGVDSLYHSITTTNFILNVRLKKIIICETSDASPFTNNATTLAENYVDGYAGLSILADYVKSNEEALFIPYDHVMLFIGYNLTNPNRSADLLGRAYRGYTCTAGGWSTSVVEEMGGYSSIHTAAHELGHGLSSNHDGDGNTCYSTDRYIMASSRNYTETPETKLNPWKFSTCSASYFSGYVSTLLQTETGTNCLTTLLSKDPQIPDTSGQLQLLGQRYPPSEQCVMLYGNNSYDCRTKSASEYCRYLTCQNPLDQTRCHIRYALEGTSCGSGKFCKGGDCVTDAAAPTVDEECVFGDETRKKFSEYENKTCATLVQADKRYCYQEYVFKFCCATCKSVKRNVPGCEYGDKISACVVNYCSTQTNLPICCETCNYTAPTTTMVTTTLASFVDTSTMTSASTLSQTPTTVSSTSSTPSTVVPTASTSTLVSKSPVPTVSTSAVFSTATTAATTFSTDENTITQRVTITGCEYGDRKPTACALVNACQTTPELCCQTCDLGRQTASVNTLSVVSAGIFLFVVHIVTPVC
ncbi:A disintegrin and metalloproteinase with thrombospondin motifs 6-like [Physella acuta]|uniref:A disintegrin and metalloproteinase with thrombospondin motifs 6-like n=1 Tax=Physella acuta TaxID=109671 RepID=UPI0027DC2228|nr:A disintegrin and metalloproteinase with thrombospondin motifs 6-like [Physella acuta]